MKMVNLRLYKEKLAKKGPRSQVRSQKFVMGGCCGGVAAEHPAAGGQAPSRRRPSPQPPEARGRGAEPPALKKFAFFCKKQFNSRAILIKDSAFKTWHRNWQRNMI